MAGIGLQHLHLAFQLGCTVNADRMRGILLVVSSLLGTVENEVGADLGHVRLLRRTDPGDHPGSFAVDRMGGFRIRFARVHRRHGGRQDQAVEIQAFERGADRLRRTEVEVGAGQAVNPGFFRKPALQRLAQPSGGTDDDDRWGTIHEGENGIVRGGPADLNAKGKRLATSLRQGLIPRAGIPGEDRSPGNNALLSRQPARR